MDSFPWVPLYSIERSGKTEVTVSGVISVVDGKGASIVAAGDTNYELWTRSCLKPWQLLSHLPTLKANYPALQPKHFALMLSSHSAESIHLKLLDEISSIGQIDQSNLQCPDTYPMAPADRIHLKDKGETPKSSFNNCSGKHMGYLLAMTAEKLPITDYLNPDGKQFENLRTLLAFLLNRTNTTFPTTTDGCRIPNYAFSIEGLSKLFVRLMSDFTPEQIAQAPKDMQPILREWPNLRTYMSEFPEVVGGTGRIDTRIMHGELTDVDELTILAKQGADGLLAIAISPTPKYSNGLGIVIKLASGTDMHHMETIVKQLFHQLDLRADEKQDTKNAHLHNTFHFSTKAMVCKTSS